MIRNSREFCVNFVTGEMEELALFCGTHSGRDMDKFKEKNIEKEECETINCARIKGCSAYLECKVKEIIELGDHFLVVGKVLRKEEGNNKKKLFQNNITGGYSFTTTAD